MGNPVVHFEIMGGTGKETAEFYSSLFDWDIDSDNEYNYGLVDTKSADGVRGGVGPVGEGVQRVTVYVSVHDINSTLEQAKKLGAEIVMERTELPGTVIMAKFRDPCGNITGLVEDGSMSAGR